MTKDTSTPRKRGRPPGSLTLGSTADSIASLPVGGSFSKAVRMPVQEFLPERRQAAFRTMASALDAGIARAKQHKGFEYASNRGEFATGDGHIILTMVVTRTA